jgi:hypothetical protein
MPHVQGSDEKIHETGRKHEMQAHGVTIGILRRDEQEKEIQGIKYCGFEVCPKGNSTKDIGIPEGDGVVVPDFIQEKLLHPQIEGRKIRTHEEMTANDDIPEEIDAGGCQDSTNEVIFFRKAFQQEKNPHAITVSSPPWQAMSTIPSRFTGAHSGEEKERHSEKNL